MADLNKKNKKQKKALENSYSPKPQKLKIKFKIGDR